ncbi:hypothetical protein HDV05_008460 [Chytridiales sp. JEL 0842]|nr:hypothetical protein HDV05_008460 [Chytridiales sp. JEL 0842]
MPEHKVEDINGVEHEIKHILTVFEQKETEETWVLFDETLAKFNAIVKDVGHLPGLPQSIRKLKQPILQALSTERTRLARTGMSLVETMANALGDRFESAADFTIPPLLRLCTRANKVFVNCANASLKAIIDNAGVPSIIPQLHEAIQSPSKTLRTCAMELLQRVMGINSTNRLEPHVETIEIIVKSAVTDSTPEVRTLARTCFELYKGMFPSRLDRFIHSLSDTAAKYLKVNQSATVAPKKLVKPFRAVRAALAQNGDDATSFSIQPLGIAATEPVEDAGDSIFGRKPQQKPQDAVRTTLSTSSSMEGLTVKMKPRLPISTPGGSEQSSLTSTPSGIGSTTAMGSMARRMLVERPTRITSVGKDEIPGIGQITHITDYAGGALRVPREAQKAPSTETKQPPKSKALRVPAAIAPTPASDSTTAAPTRSASTEPHPPHPTATPSASTSSRAAVERKDNPFKRPPTAGSTSAKQHEASSQSSSQRPSSASAPAPKEPTLNINDIVSRSKNSDWSTRLKALETLCNFIKAATAPNPPASVLTDLRTKSSKIMDVLLTGLNDLHAKCLSAALTGLAMYMQLADSKDILDSVVPRIASVVFFQTQKVKGGLLDVGKQVLLVVREKHGVEGMCLAAVHALHNPEFAKVLKYRVGCLGLLADLSDEDWGLLLAKPTNFKAIMSRVLSACLESDPVAQKSLKVIIASLYAASPDAFWNQWASIKSTDKKLVNALFGSRDLSTDRKELEAIKKSKNGAEQTELTKSPSPAKLTPRSSITFKRSPTPISKKSPSLEFKASPSSPASKSSVESPVSTPLKKKGLLDSWKKSATGSSSLHFMTGEEGDAENFPGPSIPNTPSPSDEKQTQHMAENIAEVVMVPTTVVDDVIVDENDQGMSRWDSGAALDTTPKEMAEHETQGANVVNGEVNGEVRFTENVPLIAVSNFDLVNTTIPLDMAALDSLAVDATLNEQPEQLDFEGVESVLIDEDAQAQSSDHDVSETSNTIDKTVPLDDPLDAPLTVDVVVNEDEMQCIAIAAESEVAVFAQRLVDAVEQNMTPLEENVETLPVAVDCTEDRETPTPRLLRTASSEKESSETLLKSVDESFVLQTFADDRCVTPDAATNVQVSASSSGVYGSAERLNKATVDIVATPPSVLETVSARGRTSTPSPKTPATASTPVSTKKTPRSILKLESQYSTPKAPSPVKEVTWSQKVVDEIKDTDNNSDVPPTSQPGLEADLDKALQGGLPALRDFSLKSNADVVMQSRFKDIVDVVLKALTSDIDKPTDTITIAFGLLKTLVAAKPAELANIASDIVSVVLGFDNFEEIDTNGQILIDYELDLLMEALEQSLPSSQLFAAVYSTLDKPVDSGKAKAFEILARILEPTSPFKREASREEKDGVIVSDNIIEEKILPHVSTIIAQKLNMNLNSFVTLSAGEGPSIYRVGDNKSLGKTSK